MNKPILFAGLGKQDRLVKELMVEDKGVEPSASALRTLRSPN